jgi:hypothetical protein
MGFALIVFTSVLAGALFLGGWASIDAVCDCLPLTERVAQGTLGLFAVGGVILGATAQVLWG